LFKRGCSIQGAWAIFVPCVPKAEAKAMCVGCLVISTLTFIVPVSDVPASNIPQPLTNSVPMALVSDQVSPGIVAVEKDIQAVLDQLPESEEAEFLQNGLETTLTRLDTATSEQHAQLIIDEEINKLSEAFAEAPNDEVTNILLDIQAQSNGDSLPDEPANEPESTESESLELQSNAGFTLLQSSLLDQRSGWLS
jgi:hypothetical protein